MEWKNLVGVAESHLLLINAYSNHSYFCIDRAITLSADNFNRLWVPDLFFTNEKSGSFHDVTTNNILLKVSPDGQILYSARYSKLSNHSFVQYIYI